MLLQNTSHVSDMFGCVGGSESVHLSRTVENYQNIFVLVSPSWRP